jgi:hypothetical protein
MTDTYTHCMNIELSKDMDAYVGWFFFELIDQVWICPMLQQIPHCFVMAKIRSDVQGCIAMFFRLGCNVARIVVDLQEVVGRRHVRRQRGL